MIIVIKCFSCGHLLADKWRYYVQKCKELEESKLQDTASSSAETLKNMDDVQRKEILDELGLDRLCCRRHMLSTVDMMDII